MSAITPNDFEPFKPARPIAERGGKPVNPSVVPLVEVQKLPSAAKYEVVGAGVHGLSTAWHLAMRLERSGKGKGSGTGSGAAGGARLTPIALVVLDAGGVRVLRVPKPKKGLEKLLDKIPGLVEKFQKLEGN